MFALSQSLKSVFTVYGQHVNHVCCPGRTSLEYKSLGPA